MASFSVAHEFLQELLKSVDFQISCNRCDAIKDDYAILYMIDDLCLTNEVQILERDQKKDDWVLSTKK